eukprot:gene7125-1274_t
MAGSAAGYDLYVNTFSSEGRLFQVEYASKAVEHSCTVVGLCCTDGVVIAVEKPIPAKTAVAGTSSRLAAVDKQAGIAWSGLYADGTYVCHACSLRTCHPLPPIASHATFCVAPCHTATAAIPELGHTVVARTPAAGIAAGTCARVCPSAVPSGNAAACCYSMCLLSVRRPRPNSCRCRTPPTHATVADTLRDDARQYRSNYGTPMEGATLCQRAGQLMGMYTVYYSYRPLGLAVLLASYADDGPQLYLTDPSGAHLHPLPRRRPLTAAASGTELEKLDHASMTSRDAALHLARTIYTTHDKTKDKEFELEISWVCNESNRVFQPVPQDLLKAAIAAGEQAAKDKEAAGPAGTGQS